MLSKAPESLLVTLTSLGVQPTDRAVLSRCQADEPQPVHKAMARRIVMVRNALGMAGQLTELDSFGDMCGTNLFTACGISNRTGHTE